MKHIQKTVKDYKFLYYQRHLIKGYFALPTPTIFAIKSPLGDGYIYLRQKIDALQIRDFENDFRRSVARGNAPIGVKEVPVRGITEGVAAEVKLYGREKTQTWVLTKGDLPRIINQEAYTEFLACIPLKSRDDPIVGNYQLVSDYYERFLDIYRLVSGDIAVAHFSSGLSFTPFTGEVMVEIEDHVTETFDEIIVNHNPMNFDHRMFQFDPHFTESGDANSYFNEMERAERIGHYLASSLEVDPFHRRVADLMGISQQARDSTLLILTAFPVFEAFYNTYLEQVRKQSASFNNYVSRVESRAKNNPIMIGTKLEWLPHAISALGFETDSVGEYFAAATTANNLRRDAVHKNKQVSVEEARQFIQNLTMCVTLCETSLGKSGVMISPLKRKEGSHGEL